MIAAAILIFFALMVKIDDVPLTSNSVRMIFTMVAVAFMVHAVLSPRCSCKK